MSIHLLGTNTPQSLWGGKRAGAGRPRVGRKKVRHTRRLRFNGRNPLHVTVRVRDDVPRLRRRKMKRVLARAFVRGCKKDEFRICQFSIQGNHIHLIDPDEVPPAAAHHAAPATQV